LIQIFSSTLCSQTPSVYVPPCQRPSFTPIQNHDHNYNFVCTSTSVGDQIFKERLFYGCKKQVTEPLPPTSQRLGVFREQTLVHNATIFCSKRFILKLVSSGSHFVTASFRLLNRGKVNISGPLFSLSIHTSFCWLKQR
jgi:hypothetical protein